MDNNWTLRPEFWNDDWTDLPEWKFEQGLRLSDRSTRTWVVKLTFVKNGNECTGTGFFVNLPGANIIIKEGEPGIPVDVILTAGHNLIDHGRMRTTDLKIHFLAVQQEETKDEGDQGHKEHRKIQDLEQIVEIEDAWRVCISPPYENDPRERKRDSKHDWGAIFISQEGEHHHPGFQLNLFYALNTKDGHGPVDDLLKACNVHVEGYRIGTKVGSPAVSSGKGEVKTPHQLQYHAETEQGISGSPVWAASNGQEVVLAIHTTGQLPKKSGGVRLSYEVLDTLFRWTNVGYRSSTLRVHHRVKNPNSKPTKSNAGKSKEPKKTPLDPLYLRFPDPDSDAVVRLGKDRQNTAFDIIPAVTQYGNDRLLYAFRVSHPASWAKQRGTEHLWVVWDSDRDRAVLSPTLHASSLVILEPKKTNGLQQPLRDFWLVTAGPDGQSKRELAMGWNGIDEDDVFLGVPIESSEVSFQPVKRIAGVHQFVFEAFD
ncbi:hypothetical protein BO71DRAFT_463146 [Aspergillus ellipticus CBS 707.79]|uniref:Serine protease n=1 Tax=Aspergillus ellipticus CBS 707.79 TaxID=1448320 RepID=A0A319DGI5_9EURO|nr:hypothetical protein BO71DRAFT_463146 [Aspergillus ellipticus CBS 707.79]